MGLGSTLISILAAPVVSAVDARIRERVSDMLSRLETVDPAEVGELHRRLEAAQRALSELRAEVGACRTRIDGLAPTAPTADDEAALRVAGLEARDAELTERLEGLTAGLGRLGDEIVSLRSALGGAEAHLATVEAGAAQAAKAAGSLGAPGGGARITAVAATGCKVPGCTSPHRARGYCARHYQMWKRGTLVEA